MVPWSIERRDGRYCVIKDSDGSSAGCHDSRADAIKQQRALYANESRMASMYAELDALPEEVWEEKIEIPQGITSPSELVKIEIGKENEVLVASLLERMDSMSKREQETHLALITTLQQIGTRDPTVTVEGAQITVEPATVNPTPITIEAPPINVQSPDVHVAAPAVTVNPEFVLPEESRTVKFTRDPLTGRIEGAEVTDAG